MDRQQILTEMGIEIWVPAVSEPSDSSGAGGQSVDQTVQPGSKEQSSDTLGAVLDNEQGEDSLNKLNSEVLACQRCQLCETRNNAVPGVGNPKARWMFVGEAPGAEEDRRGEPFVGRAGQLLDNIIRALGVDRKDVYIANVLKCRPPNNRDPQTTEVEKCRAYLYRQIELIRPEVVIALGAFAARELLQKELPIGKLRGQVHQLSDNLSNSSSKSGIPCVATYHPAYLLRDPGQKHQVWKDMLLAKTAAASPIQTAS
ncbi:MAG: uracil-DNA glycosylase [Proteobacteria bacterium]|jgi:uracil-DNA glycosylase|nr:uracil-DNA glycosylase [Pseudomonadota bacterium]